MNFYIGPLRFLTAHATHVMIFLLFPTPRELRRNPYPVISGWGFLSHPFTLGDRCKKKPDKKNAIMSWICYSSSSAPSSSASMVVWAIPISNHVSHFPHHIQHNKERTYGPNLADQPGRSVVLPSRAAQRYQSSLAPEEFFGRQSQRR